MHRDHVVGRGLARFVPLGVVLFACGCSSASSPTPAAPPASASLSSLSVAPLALGPAFSPTIHDYAVRCAAGANALTFQIEAASGSTAAIVVPSTSSSAASQSFAATLQENQAVAVEVTGAAGDTAQYWVRCLPHDFPRMTTTAYPAAGTPAPGWYMLGSAYVAPGQNGYAMVLDANGTPVWYRAQASGVLDVDYAADNRISFATGFGTGTAASFEVDDLASGSKSTLKAVDTDTDVHELIALPGGHHLLLSDTNRFDVDLTGLSYFGTGSTIVDSMIQELDADGKLVWQWNASDHVDAAKECTFPVQQLDDGLQAVDAFHCNSIDVKDNGDLLVSCRHLDAVFLVTRATGKIAWKLGGPAYNKDGAQLLTVENDPQAGFFRQHDARFQPNGDLSLFDDRTQKSGGARGVVYTLDLSKGTATLVWQYQGAVSSTAMGSFRRFADGTSLVGWGLPSHGNLAFTELSAGGQPMLDLAFGAGQSSYRALKVPLTAFDVNVMRRNAGM